MERSAAGCHRRASAGELRRALTRSANAPTAMLHERERQSQGRNQQLHPFLWRAWQATGAAQSDEAGACVFAARRQLCQRSPHICVCIPLGLHQLAGALDVHVAISRGACHPAGTQPGGRCAGKRALWNSSRCRAAGACWAHSRGCKRALCLAASWTTRRQRARVGKLETRQLSSAGSKAMAPPQTEVSLGPLRG